MFQIFKDRLLYSILKAEIIQRAEILCQQLDQPADDLLVEAFQKANIGTTGGAMMIGGRRTKDRTPMELKPFLEIMLSLPPELSAWLILHRIGKAILASGLPIQLQGDIMMAFECANYVLPEKTTEAARHLAYALCLMPSLSRARATLMNLGVPRGQRLSEEEVTALIKQGYLPPDMMSFTGFTHLGWNLDMRRAVAKELERIAPEASRLFQIDRMREREPEGIRRWTQMPSPEANDLLQKGIDLAGLGQFDAAFDMLDKAALADPVLLPDALRNKAWILAKQKLYHEASELCRQALDIDPEYAEVWYHMGICLAKLRRFSEALDAFEKAKSLGFRSAGLEPNIATCRRAISHGLR